MSLMGLAIVYARVLIDRKEKKKGEQFSGVAVKFSQNSSDPGDLVGDAVRTGTYARDLGHIPDTEDALSLTHDFPAVLGVMLNAMFDGPVHGVTRHLPCPRPPNEDM